MLDNMVICKKLGVLLQYYKELKEVASNLSLDEYKSRLLVKRAIEREIQLIVECATDINNMVLRKLGKGPSKDYFTSFIDLAENNVIDMHFALKIAPSTGLRNILVHEYQKIDDSIVFKSIKNILDYYIIYFEKIYSYIGCE